MIRLLTFTAALVSLAVPAVATARDYDAGKVKVYADNRAVCDNNPFGQAERRRTIKIAQQQIDLIRASGRKAKLIELWPEMGERCFTASRRPHGTVGNGQSQPGNERR